MKVASTENGVIFSTISYDVRGSTSDRNCVYLQDIKIDIMVSCPLGFKNKKKSRNAVFYVFIQQQSPFFSEPDFYECFRTHTMWR